MRYLGYIITIFIILGSPSCKTDVVVNCDEVLFGIPGERTGLTSEECLAVCECKGYTPRDFSSSDLSELRDWELTAPQELLLTNPYDAPLPPAELGVCAIIVVDQAEKKYRLESFPSAEAATSAGAIVTHNGPCGQCSSLKDLAVYLEI